MKNVLLAAGIALAASVAGPAWAQAPAEKPTAESVKQAAIADKRGLVEKNMQLTAEEGKKFWPLYDAYQRDLDKIVQRQNRVVLDYVNSESSLTDANAKRLATEFMAADKDEQKLRDKLFHKVMDVLPPKKAIRYIQIENKLRTINSYQIAERIPLVR